MLELALASNQFQQSLICLQIDAVFNGLVALIETERIKLKALMNPMVSSMTAEMQTYANEPAGVREQSDSRDEPEVAIDQQIAQIFHD